MTFEEWFGEVELFSTRDERFYNDLDHHKPYEGSYGRMMAWLKAAYDVGYEQGKLDR
jgi:hypothetical protein